MGDRPRKFHMVMKGGFLVIHIPIKFIGELIDDKSDDFADVSITSFLTTRQRQVFNLIRQGLVHKEIGLKLNLTERTAKSHANALYKIIGVKDRVELLRKYGYAKKGEDDEKVEGGKIQVLESVC
jgi:DNA-binding NarL/FixJ family response regulator